MLATSALRLSFSRFWPIITDATQAKRPVKEETDLITQELLSSKISEKLLYEMKQGKYLREDRLPPELIIAKDLNVSRTAVRDSLAILEREGFISRKPGVGTIINHHVLNVTTRMDLEQEFLEIIKCAGYKAGTARCDWRYGKACEAIATRLDIAAGDDVIQVERVITADGMPAIYSIDTIAKSLVVKPKYDDAALKRPIFDFLETYCDTNIFMDLTEIRAVAASASVAAMLALKEGTPVL